MATTLDGYLVLSKQLGLKSLVNASKDSDRRLESSDRFKRALEGHPERLGLAYVDTRSAFDAVPSAGAEFLAPFRRAFRDPVVGTATAQSDALEITSKTPQSLLSVLGVTGLGSKGTDLIGKLRATRSSRAAGPSSAASWPPGLTSPRRASAAARSWR